MHRTCDLPLTDLAETAQYLKVCVLKLERTTEIAEIHIERAWMDKIPTGLYYKMGLLDIPCNYENIIWC
jgi:hypothetical protein